MGAVEHLTVVNSLATSVNVARCTSMASGAVMTTRSCVVAKSAIIGGRPLARRTAQRGYYIQVGETQGKERLTKAELAKLAHIPGAVDIYDNGPIQIYDLLEVARAGANRRRRCQRRPGRGRPELVRARTSSGGGACVAAQAAPFDGSRPGRSSAAVGGRAGHHGRVCARPVGDPDDAGGARDSGASSCWSRSSDTLPAGRPALLRRGRTGVARATGRYVRWVTVVTVLAVAAALGVGVVSARAFWSPSTSLSVVTRPDGALVATVVTPPGHDVTLRASSGRRMKSSELHSSGGTWVVDLPRTGPSIARVRSPRAAGYLGG